MIVLFRIAIQQDIKMLDEVKTSERVTPIKKTQFAKVLDTQLSVSAKADLEDGKDRNIVMEDTEFPKIRRFTRV